MQKIKVRLDTTGWEGDPLGIVYVMGTYPAIPQRWTHPT